MTNKKLAGLSRGPAKKRQHLVARATLLGASVMLVGAGGIVSASAATAKQASSHAAVVKPDFAFFKGKTITYISDHTAGTTPSIVAAAQAIQMGNYLHASVNMVYVGGSNTIGVNQVAAAQPSGLTIGTEGSTSSLLQDWAINSHYTFPIAKTPWIGSLRQPVDMVASCLGSGITSFASVIKNHTPLVALTQAGSPAALINQSLAMAYNLPIKSINGFTGTTLGTGCESGEGNISGDSMTDFLTAAQNAYPPGVKPLVISGQPRVANLKALAKNVPTFEDIYTKYPPKTALGKKVMQLLIAAEGGASPWFGTMTTPGTPQSRILALQAAFKYAAQQGSVERSYLSQGINSGWISAPAVAHEMSSFLKQKSFVDQIFAYDA